MEDLAKTLRGPPHNLLATISFAEGTPPDVLGTGAATAATGTGPNVGVIVSQVAGGGVGGAILMATVDLIRSMMSNA